MEFVDFYHSYVPYKFNRHEAIYSNSTIFCFKVSIIEMAKTTVKIFILWGTMVEEPDRIFFLGGGECGNYKNSKLCIGCSVAFKILRCRQCDSALDCKVEVCL